jgi:pimeloyl-ACP methyl ester carboxylesterase
VSIQSGFQIAHEELVEQVVDRDWTCCLRKQRVVFPGDVPLAAVRKTLPEGATRPAVLLVHGFAQNRYSWHTSRRSMSAWLAAQGWDVWNLELRGHGHSRGLAEAAHVGLGAETFQDYVDDVVRIAQVLGPSTFLMGHSLGGAACYAAATLVPVAGVVGIGAMFSFARHNWLLGLLARATRVLDPIIRASRLTIRTQVFGKIAGRLYQVTDIAGYTFPISGWWPGSVERDLLHERLVHGFDWTSVTVWLEMCRWHATGRFDYQDPWQVTDVPLAVVVGDRDHLMPLGDARPAYDLSGSTDKVLKIFEPYDHEVHWGHLDLILGSRAPANTWRWMDAWMADRIGDRLIPTETD